MTAEETRSYSHLKQSQSNLLQGHTKCFCLHLGEEKGERQLDALGAGTHELCKQTETNWNIFIRKTLHVAL